MTKGRLLIEITIVLVLLFILLKVAISVKFLRENPSSLQTVVLTIWIFIPTLVITFHGRDFREYGITLQGWSMALKEAIMLAVLVLPLFIVTYILCRKSFYSEAKFPIILDKFLLKSLSIFLFISIPEEFFFRGYLQTEFNRIFGKQYCLLRTRFGPGLFVTAILFAFVHVWICSNWFGLAGFFPGLLFGWLREKTEGITAPVFFHGICDITYIILK